MAEVEAAGRIIGLRTEKLTAGSEDEIDAAFASLAQRRVDAVMVGADGFLITRCNQIVALASHYRIPGIYPFVDFPETGGLMSYGASLSDSPGRRLRRTDSQGGQARRLASPTAD